MPCRLEHANITVRNLERAASFITTALPEFRIRGGDKSGRESWLHVGTDDSYISLTHSPDALTGKRKPYADLGVNHIGVVVEDVESVIARLLSAGYRQSSGTEVTPWRKRYYFLDDDDLEWEFIEYMSDDPEKKNHYE